MTIAIFGTSLLYPSNEKITVSGHAQPPLMTATLLAESGYNVSVITTSAPDNYELPPFVSNSVDLTTVPNIFSTDRGGSDTVIHKYPKFIYGLGKEIKRLDPKLIHFFGTEKIGLLAHFITTTTTITEKHITYVNYRGGNTATRTIRRYSGAIDQIHFLTDYTKNQYCQNVLQNAQTNVTRPGIIRELNNEQVDLPSVDDEYVLFWRNAHPNNGADICEKVFKDICDDYPNIDFIFAVRHNDMYEPELEDTCANKANLHLYRHPYPDNMNIESLLTGAAIVVLPFRKLSINPQFSILETLASGTPVITTPIESNSEIICDNDTGILTPPKTEPVKSALVELLENKTKRERIGDTAATNIKDRWNWERYQESLLEEYNLW